MIRFNRRTRYGIWTLAAFLLASCSKPEEEKNDEYLLSYGKVDVTVSVILPQPEVVKASTRLVYDKNHTPYSTDTEIRNMDMLIFDKDAKFMKRVKVGLNQLKVTETGVSFTVQLDATPEKRIIHLVTNGHGNGPWLSTYEDRLNFDVLSVGMSEQDAISSLRTEPAQYPYMHHEPYVYIAPLIMWGRFVLENGTNVSEPITGVRLLRSTAAIQVKKGDAAGADNGLDDFQVIGIGLYNSYAQGFLAPVDCTGMVSAPTTAHPFPQSKIMGLVVINQKMMSVSDNTVHTYERYCTPDDCMSIIIYAQYKGVYGFYKVVMTDRDGVPLDIIRNHRYIVRIVGVNGPGA